MGCRRTAPTTELVRLSRDPDGRLVVGVGRPGRGAWLCRGSPRCVELARQRRAIERALRAAVAPGALASLAAVVAGGSEASEGGAEVCEDGATGRTVGARPKTGKGP